MKEFQTYDVGDGTVATVIWLNADHQPVAPERATSARITFSNGETAVFVVERPTVRTASRAEGSIHAAADSMIPRLSVAFRHAFAVARKRLRSTRDPEAAVWALRATLGDTLPKALLAVVAAGGEVGAEGLRKLKIAEFNPDQPRDESGKWTSEAGNSITEPQETGQHYYHRTTREALEGIRKEGLKPGEDTESVSLATSLESVSWHAEHNIGRQAPILLRVRKSALKVEQIYTDVVASKRIAPKKIEVFEEGQWRALEFRTAKRDPAISLKFKFNAVNPAVVKWAKQHAAELIDDISATSLKRIRRTIADFTEGEKDWTAALDVVEDAVGDLDRAELIARNETMLAANFGQREAWSQAVEEGLLPEDAKRTWITVGDDKVCPICEPLDGSIADLDSGYPGEGGDGPPAHVSCRCTEGIA